jgi:hypothetical protein
MNGTHGMIFIPGHTDRSAVKAAGEEFPVDPGRIRNIKKSERIKDDFFYRKGGGNTS